MGNIPGFVVNSSMGKVPGKLCAVGPFVVLNSLCSARLPVSRHGEEVRKYKSCKNFDFIAFECCTRVLYSHRPGGEWGEGARPFLSHCAR